LLVELSSSCKLSFEEDMLDDVIDMVAEEAKDRR
jgi:hypothetical protein